MTFTQRRGAGRPIQSVIGVFNTSSFLSGDSIAYSKLSGSVINS